MSGIVGATNFVKKRPIYTTFRGDDNVTYQIMAYRALLGNEAKKTVVGYLKNARPQNRPKAGDVVIVDTAIGLRRN